jgi:hypothetical protein
MRYAWALGGMVVVLVGLSSVVQAQQMGAGAAAGIGAGTIPGTPFGGAIDPTMVQVREGFQVIPSISAGQRYDSNVYFVSKRPGLDREDFVSTAVPQVRGYYVGNWFDMNASAAAIGEYYAKNPTLNYVGTNTGLVLNLSKLLDRWWQGATLTASNTYVYSPQAPAFLIGNQSGINTSPFATGFQVGRVNVKQNILRTDLAVPLTQTLSLLGSYGNGFNNYGSSDVQQSGVLIDSTYQTYSGGLSLRASPQDLFTVQAVNTNYDYSGQASGSFTTRGGIVGWDHTPRPFLTLQAQAGAMVLERDFAGASDASLLAPVGHLALLWKDRTTALTLAYDLGVSPSFQFQAQALQTHVVSVTLTQQTAIPELLAVANVNYGHGDEIGASAGTNLSYATVMGTGGVVYKFSPETFLGLHYSYSNVENQFNGSTFAFDRQVVQLSLTQAFY